MNDPWQAQRNYAISVTKAGDVAAGEALRAVLADADALHGMVRWIDENRHADWPYASFNLEEWEKQKEALPEHLRRSAEEQP